MTYTSMEMLSPTQTRVNLPPLLVHLPLLHEPESHSSSLSQSSPPDFFAAVHWPLEQLPLAHSSSFSQSSPPLFLSAHLPPTHELLEHCESLSQSSPEPFLLLQPGKSGGHSAPTVSAHCLGGSWPGSEGAGPVICALMGTV